MMKLAVTVGTSGDSIVHFIGASIRKRSDVMNLKEWNVIAVAEGSR